MTISDDRLRLATIGRWYMEIDRVSLDFGGTASYLDFGGTAAYPYSEHWLGKCELVGKEKSLKGPSSN